MAAIGDAAAGQIVWREFDIDVVAGRDTNAEPAQAAGEAGQDRVAVFEFDLERRAGKRLDDAADKAQRIFFDDGREGLAAFLAAAPPSARRGNTGSFSAEGWYVS